METNGADSHNDAVSNWDLLVSLTWKMLVLGNALSNPDGVFSADALEELAVSDDFGRRPATPSNEALHDLKNAAREFVEMKLFVATSKGDGDESRVVSWHITDRDRAEHLMRLFKAEASSHKAWANSQLR